MTDSSFPQVYAARTSLNERIISLLSSITFRRYDNPNFVNAANQMLPLSLEVQNPSCMVTYASSSAPSLLSSSTASQRRPILLIVLSSLDVDEDDDDSYSTLSHVFVETAKQSSAYIVLEKFLMGDDDRRTLANIAHLCTEIPSSIPAFLVMFGSHACDLFWREHELNTRYHNGSTARLSVDGIVSIHAESYEFDQDPHPFGLLPSQSTPYLRIVIGRNLAETLEAHYSHLKNPNIIIMAIPHIFPSADLWMARVLFKYFFAMMQSSANAVGQKFDKNLDKGIRARL